MNDVELGQVADDSDEIEQEIQRLESQGTDDADTDDDESCDQPANYFPVQSQTLTDESVDSARSHKMDNI